MKTIYQQFDNAFSLVSAGVIVNANGEQIGKIAIKYPRDGAGRLTMFLHLHGYQMARGTAGGYGYDKAGAAFESAARELCKNEQCLADCPYIAEWADIGGHHYQDAIQKSGLRFYHAI